MIEEAIKSAAPGPLRFGERYEKSAFGGPWLLTSLGRPRLLEGSASASLEFSSSRSSGLRVAEGRAAGKSWLELVGEYGDRVAGRKGLELMETGLALEIRFRAADAAGSPVRLPRARDPEPLGRGHPVPWLGLVIIETQPGAKIYCGRRRSLPESQFLSSLRQGLDAELLEEFSAQPGQALVIPPGLPFALGQGVLAYEAEVSEDPVEKTGSRTPPGLGHGGHVITAPVTASRLFAKSVGYLDGRNAVTWLLASRLAAVARLELRAEWSPATGELVHESFIALTGLEGRALVVAGSETETITRGRTLVVPAGAPSLRVNPGPEGAVILKTWLPDPAREIEEPLRAHGLRLREIEGLYGLPGKK
jgi:mannose-6-phosphate isomerase